MIQNGALEIAGSGLAAATTRLGVSAHNLANLQSEGFRPLRVLSQGVPGGGTMTQVAPAPQAREVDLAHEIVSQLLAAREFEASLRVAGSALDLQGRLIDLLA